MSTAIAPTLPLRLDGKRNTPSFASADHGDWVADYDKATRLRPVSSAVKRLIVTAGMRGIAPNAVVTWLLQSLHLEGD